MLETSSTHPPPKASKEPSPVRMILRGIRGNTILLFLLIVLQAAIFFYDPAAPEDSDPDTDIYLRINGSQCYQQKILESGEGLDWIMLLPVGSNFCNDSKVQAEYTVMDLHPESEGTIVNRR